MMLFGRGLSKVLHCIRTCILHAEIAPYDETDQMKDMVMVGVTSR